MSAEKIVIIGAGHAGSSAAAFLRQYGFKGSITLVGDEAGLPYQRPPLSKAWLKGASDPASLVLRPKDFYAAHAIELRTSTLRRTNNTCADGICLRVSSFAP